MTHQRSYVFILAAIISICPLVVPLQAQDGNQDDLDQLREQIGELRNTIQKQSETIQKQQEQIRELDQKLKEHAETSGKDRPEKQAEETDKEEESDPGERIDQLEREVAKLRFQMPESPEPVLPEGLRTQEEPNALNPQITVYSNHLFRADNRDVVRGGSRVDETYRLRANEIDMRGSIGPYADGVAILAAPQQPDGAFDVKFEELYAHFKDYPFFEEPPLDMRVKLGRFRTELGRMNRLHFHDLPQPDRPFAFREFLGGGGWQGDGASARFQLPTSFFDDQSALELTVQALNDSEKLRLAEAGGADTAKEPAGVANLHWSRSLGDAHFLDASLMAYEGSTNDAGGNESVSLQSVEGLYKWNPAERGEWQSFLLGGQVYRGDRTFSGGGTERTETPLGGFAWSQYQFNQRWFAGVRYDYSQSVLNDDLETHAGQPYVTYKWNEALQTRVGFRRQWSDIEQEDGLNTFFFELTFWFGSHPPHPFWVEK